jgi:hypothetical protein
LVDFREVRADTRAMRRSIAIAALAITVFSTAAFAHDFTAPKSYGNRPAMPARTMFRLFGLPKLHHPADLGADLVRDDGRQVLYFPIGESAAGLFVQVSGSVEFERALIGNADGTVENVDAFGVSRENGLFELAGFDNDRQVQWVRLILRARSRHARVGVIIGR